MNYTIEKDVDNNLVTVTYTPNTSYQDRIDVLNQLTEIAKQNPTINYLIDVRNARLNLTAQDQIDFGKLVGTKAGSFIGSKIAVLIRKNDNPNPLIPTACYLQGLQKIVEFDNQNEANSWLRGEIN